MFYQWRYQKFLFGGAIAQRVWEVPWWRSRGKAPRQWAGNFVPRSWSSLQTLFTHFDCRNDQNSKLCDWHPNFWPVCFMVGLSDILAQAHAWPRHCVSHLKLSICKLPTVLTATKPSFTRYKSSHTFAYPHCFSRECFKSLILSHFQYLFSVTYLTPYTISCFKSALKTHYLQLVGCA